MAIFWFPYSCNFRTNILELRIIYCVVWSGDELTDHMKIKQRFGDFWLFLASSQQSFLFVKEAKQSHGKKSQTLQSLNTQWASNEWDESIRELFISGSWGNFTAATQDSLWKSCSSHALPMNSVDQTLNIQCQLEPFLAEHTALHLALTSCTQAISRFETVNYVQALM